MDSNTASPSLQNTLPPMNPAEVSQLQADFAYQSEVLKGYQEQLNKLQSANEHLTHYIRSLEFRTLTAQSGWNDISLKAVILPS